MLFESSCAAEGKWGFALQAEGSKAAKGGEAQERPSHRSSQRDAALVPGARTSSRAHVERLPAQKAEAAVQREGSRALDRGEERPSRIKRDAAAQAPPPKEEKGAPPRFCVLCAPATEESHVT